MLQLLWKEIVSMVLVGKLITGHHFVLTVYPSMFIILLKLLQDFKDTCRIFFLDINSKLLRLRSHDKKTKLSI